MRRGFTRPDPHPGQSARPAAPRGRASSPPPNPGAAAGAAAGRRSLGTRAAARPLLWGGVADSFHHKAAKICALRVFFPSRFCGWFFGALCVKSRSSGARGGSGACPAGHRAPAPPTSPSSSSQPRVCCHRTQGDPRNSRGHNPLLGKKRAFSVSRHQVEAKESHREHRIATAPAPSL